jgi:hypothetical protein
MSRLGRSLEQQARSRMFPRMASIAFGVLAVAGVALGVMGNVAGWGLVAVSVVLWLGMFLTLRFAQGSQGGGTVHR